MRTSAGIDWQAGVMGNTSSNGSGSYAPATYIALSSNATAPSSSDSTLTGEITGSSGYLNRKQATYVHTSGTNTYTLSATFTSDQTVTIQKIGVFTASSGGMLFIETALAAPVSLNSGDTLFIQETVTL
jgi:hypothetical protein